jgi:hypothetical protein
MTINATTASANNLPVGKAHHRSRSKAADSAQDTAAAAVKNATSKLSVSAQNFTAASSPIQDVDTADASTESARANILAQPGTAMLAQANSLPPSALLVLQQ